MKTINDYSINFDWDITFYPPQGIASVMPDSLKLNKDYIISTSLPSRNTELIQYNYYNGQNNYAIKNDFDIDNFTINMRCDSLESNYNFMLNWNALKGIEPENDGPILSRYPAEYQGKIITDLKHNLSQLKILNVEFIKIYPHNIGDLQLTYEGDVEIKTFDVSFVFVKLKKTSLFFF